MKREDILIEADELLTKLDRPNVRIYDATILFFSNETKTTAYDNYLEGHIPGAAFFDHQAFSDANNKYMYMVPPAADLAAQIGNIGIAKESEVIFYVTETLPSATRAWWLLRYAGHNNVRVLNGGLAAWQKAGGQIEKGLRQYEPAKFECQLRPYMFANKDDVLKAMEDGAVCTVNTLNLDSYEQAHITGSSLLPCTDLMHGMDALVSDDKIAARLKDEAQHERIITYCGGGIAATLNAVAHLIAGNENVSVYDGSMSEWTGEKLPITQGKLPK